MLTDSSSRLHSEMVPINGLASDNDDQSSRMVMYGIILYENLVRDSKLFWDTLRDFLKSLNITLKIPIVGGYKLDLHKLFKEVTSRGGFEKVIKDRKGKEVMEAFDFKTPLTNASFVLRKHYLHMLFEFEHVYYQAPLSSSLEIHEKQVKLLDEKSANRDESPQELQLGSAVSGIINGTFKDGCFVTVKVGSEELRGMFLKIHPESIQRRKKKLASQVGPQKPKFKRCGYNFFFAEHARLIMAEFPGQVRLATKKIGKMWKNLSKSDKQVYQEKGLEDVQRYNREMLEYKSLMDSRAAGTVAANDATALDH